MSAGFIIEPGLSHPLSAFCRPNPAHSAFLCRWVMFVQLLFVHPRDEWHQGQLLPLGGFSWRMMMFPSGGDSRDITSLCQPRCDGTQTTPQPWAWMSSQRLPELPPWFLCGSGAVSSTKISPWQRLDAKEQEKLFPF